MLRRKASRGPRKQLFPQITIQPDQFTDHQGHTYQTIGGSQGYFTDNQTFIKTAISKLSIHLYILNATPSDSSLAIDLASRLKSSEAIAGWGNARNYWPRVDVYYSNGFSTPEACIDHHREEKIYRQNAIIEQRRKVTIEEDDGTNLSESELEEVVTSKIRGRQPLPHIVPTWCCSREFWNENSPSAYQRYRSWILVVQKDCKTWADVVEKGLLLLQFDRDVYPEMETTTWGEGLDEDAVIQDGKEWMYIDKSGLGELPPMKQSLLCLREPPLEPFSELKDYWKTPGFDRRLIDVWRGYTGMLWDCTYRKVLCEMCVDNQPHEDCENDLYEHFFDDDGQCVACRRSLEYRRRSKRLKTKRGITK